MTSELNHTDDDSQAQHEATEALRQAAFDRITSENSIDRLTLSQSLLRQFRQDLALLHKGEIPDHVAGHMNNLMALVTDMHINIDSAQRELVYLLKEKSNG